ncbi:hypothetical protein [Celeribacter halophilus]|uniref:Secreted protein n=1 Tax=Celeribacter halophilus TaxID=576117 RepID=A0A1I3TEG5_9RHOB|nr:hypothetical protein [Celeribacter halophilus]PZX11165.1 hypothetical protein LX82_02124 [Celeribacter halophilus]SFJ67857.1 hypothetical protein SAMN04488138_10822 [Celeribacter halophilus]
MKHLIYALPLIALTTGAAFAQNGPRLPMNEIASEIGVSEAQLKQCFKDNAPSREEMKAAKESGKRPDGERGPNPELISCLQEHNPEITAESFKAVMKEHRPERPAQN